MEKRIFLWGLHTCSHHPKDPTASHHRPCERMRRADSYLMRQTEDRSANCPRKESMMAPLNNRQERRYHAQKWLDLNYDFRQELICSQKRSKRKQRNEWNRNRIMPKMNRQDRVICHKSTPKIVIVPLISFNVAYFWRYSNFSWDRDKPDSPCRANVLFAKDTKKS